MHRRRLLPLVWTTILLIYLPHAALSYTIILKDGSTLLAKNPYTVQGDKALVTLPSGTQTMLPIAEINVEETKKANERDYGTALVVGKSGVRPLTRTETSRRETTLSDLLRNRRDTSEEPALRLGPSGRDESAQPRKTVAGHNDLRRFPRKDFKSPEITSALETALSNEALGQFEVLQGTQPERILITFIANTESGVLRSLEGSAKAFVEINRRFPEVEAVEVLMMTTSRARAGQFLLTQANAPLLAGQRITPGEFYIQYVEF